MLETPIRWGILGTSYISEVMAKAIQDSSYGQLTAIASRSMDSAKNFSQKFSVPTLYADYQAMLNSVDIDVIYIGLPNHVHKEWMLRCIQAGKHVLCEKPFVISVAEAHEIMAMSESNNIICMEALMYKFHPFIKKLQELIDSKILGDIKLYNATYTANITEIANPTAGGSIRNLGCYPISLVRLLAKAEPIEIVGAGRMASDSHRDNQASVILKFPDNAIAVISTADDMEMCWQFDIYGSKGHLKVITNPWLPSGDNNIILIYLNNEIHPIEIKVQADKSLYTYQIDTLNQQLIQKEKREFCRASLLESLGNTRVLETWLNQVKNMTPADEACVA